MAFEEYSDEQLQAIADGKVPTFGPSLTGTPSTNEQPSKGNIPDNIFAALLRIGLPLAGTPLGPFGAAVGGVAGELLGSSVQGENPNMWSLLLSGLPLAGRVGSGVTAGVAGAMRKSGWLPNLFEKAAQSGEQVAIPNLAKAIEDSRALVGSPPYPASAGRLLTNLENRIEGADQLPINEVERIRRAIGTALETKSTRSIGKHLYSGQKEDLEAGGEGAQMLLKALVQERARRELMRPLSLQEALVRGGLPVGAGYLLGHPNIAGAGLFLPPLLRAWRAGSYVPGAPWKSALGAGVAEEATHELMK